MRLTDRDAYAEASFEFRGEVVFRDIGGSVLATEDAALRVTLLLCEGDGLAEMAYALGKLEVLDV